jgi:hypothetical protein
MNKLKTMLCAVFTLMLVNISTTAQSDSSNFAGPYIGLSISGYGMQLSGDANTSPTGGSLETDEVSIGQVAPVTGVEAGYVIPLGSHFLLDIGASLYTGEAKVEFESDRGIQVATGEGFGDTLVAKNVSLTMNDLTTGWIAPTLVLSDTSSLYLKLGLSEAKIITTGDVTPAADLSGTTWALGTRTVLESGIFVKTEAGYTEYNGISAHGLGNSISADNSYSAQPTVAYGLVSIGFRF